jgi:prophage regulatory protein
MTNQQNAKLKMLTMDQLSELLGLNRATIYRMIGSGRMPRPVKFGKSTRFREKTILEWLDNGCPSVVAGSRKQQAAAI